MKQIEIVIHNRTGLHARPAKVLVNLAKQFKSNISLQHAEKKANAKSMVSVLTLGAVCGSAIIVQASGEDEEKAIAEIEAAIGLAALVFHGIFARLTDWCYEYLLPVLGNEGLALGAKLAVSCLLILPQSIPVVTTVGLLHFFYIWNETRLSSLYLGIAPHLQLVSFGVQRSQTFFFTPEALMVGALIVMIIPVTVLFLSQRFFMQDMIVTQIEK